MVPTRAGFVEFDERREGVRLGEDTLELVKCLALRISQLDTGRTCYLLCLSQLQVAW